MHLLANNSTIDVVYPELYTNIERCQKELMSHHRFLLVLLFTMLLFAPSGIEVFPSYIIFPQVSFSYPFDTVGTDTHVHFNL